MYKFLAIFKREYAQIVKKKSFIIGILLIPVFMGLLILLPAMLARQETAVTEKLAVIDQSGMEIAEEFAESLQRYKLKGTDTPSYSVRGIFRPAADDDARFQVLYDSLAQLVTDKGLKYFLVVKPDPHLADSNVFMVTNSDDFNALSRFEYRLSNVLAAHRLRLSNINLPVDSVLALTERVDLVLRDTMGQSIPFTVKYFGALIFVMIIYMMIVGYGAVLMRSVIEEKNSRIVEVLVSSVSPFQLMLGKVLGMGAAAFTQVAIWVVIGALISVSTGAAAAQALPAVQRIAFNPVIVTFFILFFISGYLLYSTFFALIGAIVNSDKEAQSFVMPISLSLIFPVIIGIAVVRDPYATWVLVLSFIPLFSPTLMLMRVIFIAPTVAEYSLFSGIVAEGALAFLLIVLALIGTVWVTGRIFRVGILMYGKRPTLPELIRWVRY
ncbi:MAG TPA: ABC transporter permease [Acidobacteriota bacterium]|nr:ABC transporter permease [Acidobacteriota bacterium]